MERRGSKKKWGILQLDTKSKNIFDDGSQRMLRHKKIVLVVVAIAVLVAAGAVLGTGAVQAASTPKDKLTIGEADVKQLLLLMDADMNGKISKEEYMRFMAAEFDRLDKDNSGELDVKELTQSTFRVSHSGHR
jgi:Ca2+-binding EF-hand superfamily protein